VAPDSAVPAMPAMKVAVCPVPMRVTLLSLPLMPILPT